MYFDVRILMQERQLPLYGHVARLPTKNPSHRILPCRDQVDAYLKDMGMTGPTSALATARRLPKENRHKVDAATRCFGVCTYT